jgi:hypothetical protein
MQRLSGTIGLKTGAGASAVALGLSKLVLRRP